MTVNVTQPAPNHPAMLSISPSSSSADHTTQQVSSSAPLFSPSAIDDITAQLQRQYLQQQQSQSPPSPDSIESPRNLHIDNIPSHWSDSDIFNIFSTVGVIVRSRVVKETGTGQNAGYAFVMYETEDDARRAIQSFHNHQMEGKVLRVTYKRKKQLSPLMAAAGYQPTSSSPLIQSTSPVLIQGSAVSPTAQNGYHTPSPYAHAFHGSHTSLASLPTSVPSLYTAHNLPPVGHSQLPPSHSQHYQAALTPHTNLYVAGLPLAYSKQDLEHVFGSFGNIIESRILVDKQTNMSRGVGFVRFESLDSCYAAISQWHGKSINLLPKPVANKADDNKTADDNEQKQGEDKSTSDVHHPQPAVHHGHPVPFLTVRFAVDKPSNSASPAISANPSYNNLHALANNVTVNTSSPLKLGMRRTSSQLSMLSLGSSHPATQSQTPTVDHGLIGPDYYQAQPYSPLITAGNGYGLPQGVSPMHPLSQPFTFQPSDVAASHPTPASQSPSAFSYAPSVAAPAMHEPIAAAPLSISTLFVCHLASTVSESDLYPLFESFGSLHSVAIMRDLATGQSKCYGFVNFFSQLDAQRAMQALNNYTVHDKAIQCSFKKQSSYHSYARKASHAQQQHMQSYQYANSMLLPQSPPMMQQLHITSSPTTQPLPPSHYPHYMAAQPVVT